MTENLKMLSIEETLNMESMSKFDNINWLPVGSYIEVILFNPDTQKYLLHESLVSHSFVTAFINNKIVLTNHTKRKLQISGGKKEIGETQIHCAKRETYEEVGLNMKSSQLDCYGLKPLGFARIFVPGEKPNDSRYPHPYSIMSFFGKNFTYNDLHDPTAPLSECSGISILDIDTIIKDISDIGEIDKIFIKHYKNNFTKD